ncbi:MAG: leucine-rich repeat protein, partial [Clostridia bacterium]|nr:leucine-rich repeat protein [Clostridia bacterium]
GITYISSYAFINCTSLESITIPSSVTSIAMSAFADCTVLTEMIVLATTPPTMKYTNAISSATTTIYVPYGTIDAYKAATNWSGFASKFVELNEDGSKPIVTE